MKEHVISDEIIKVKEVLRKILTRSKIRFQETPIFLKKLKILRTLEEETIRKDNEVLVGKKNKS